MQPINSPETITVVFIRNAFGSTELHFSANDLALAAFRDDPDDWAAAYFGLSLADYREWIECIGIPLCGATTKRGTLCRMPIGGQHHAAEWKQLHRNHYCKRHQQR